VASSGKRRRLDDAAQAICGKPTGSVPRLGQMDVRVNIGAAADVATALPLTVVVGDGLRLSDSVAMTLVRGDRELPFRVDPSVLRWFLTSEGAALAAWLSLLYLLANCGR